MATTTGTGRRSSKRPSPRRSASTSNGDITKYHFELPLRDEEALRIFLDVAWGVRFPDKKVCAHHSSPWTAFKEAYFATEPVTVWYGSRKLAGKTFALGTLGLTEAVTLACDVNVLGGSGEQSARVLETHDELWRHPYAPRKLLASAPAGKITRLRNRAKLRALMASQTSARGGHPVRLRLDEIDEMSLELLLAVLGQPTSRNGILSQVVLSSTYHNVGGTMAHVLKVLAKEKGWPIHRWCWRETSAMPNGWLSLDEVERTRKTVTEETWRVEHELGEPNPGARAINPEKVDRMFRKDLGTFSGEPGTVYLSKGLRRSRVYAHGADLAFVRDWCCFATLEVDERPLRLVCFEKFNRVPYPLVAKRHDKRVATMPGESRYDKSGVGIAVGQLMAATDTEGVTITGGAGPNSRATILGDYVTAVENEELVAPFIESMYESHRDVTNEMLFGPGHPPDDIVAMALAYRAARIMIGNQLVAPVTSGQASYWTRRARGDDDE